jgi:hypothetical protein
MVRMETLFNALLDVPDRGITPYFRNVYSRHEVELVRKVVTHSLSRFLLVYHTDT